MASNYSYYANKEYMIYKRKCPSIKCYIGDPDYYSYDYFNSEKAFKQIYGYVESPYERAMKKISAQNILTIEDLVVTYGSGYQTPFANLIYSPLWEYKKQDVYLNEEGLYEMIYYHLQSDK